MKERLIDKIKRKIGERRIKILHWIIRKAVRRLDIVHGFAFMAYSWGVDEVTDYHVIAERSYPDMHIYGTKWERYEDNNEDNDGKTADRVV